MYGELKRAADLVLFARIVQAGGISRCAASLGMERTTVSRRLALLERSMGVTLLERSPKRTTMTAAGRRCYQSCEELLEVLRTAERAASDGNIVINPQPITIGAPADIIDRYLEAAIEEFEKTNPDIIIKRQPVSDWSGSIFSSVDMLVAWKSPGPSEHHATKISAVEQSTYASPDCIDRYGAPLSPVELDKYPCIGEETTKKSLVWKFRTGNSWSRFSIKPKYQISNLLEAREAAIAGLGLCQLPRYLCEPFVQAGRLLEVLPDFAVSTRDLFMISSRESLAKPRAASFRTFLEDSLRSATAN